MCISSGNSNRLRGLVSFLWIYALILKIAIIITMKGIVAVDAAFRSVDLAMNDTYIFNVHGINGRTPELTMKHMGLIASPGMVGTEKTIVEIFEEKLSE